MKFGQTFRLPRLMLVLVVSAPSNLSGPGIARGDDADAPQDVSRQVIRLVGSSGLCASFSSDGTRILTAGNDEARVWDAKTFKPVIEPIRHKDIHFAALSPDGKEVVTCGVGSARLWDAKTGKELVPPLKHEVPVNEDGVVSMAAFSPDGSRLTTACGDGKVRIWDAGTGRELVEAIDIRRGAVLSVAFSPDGTKILSVTDGTSQLWDASTGKLFAPLVHGRDWTHCAAFSRDGKRVATGHSDGIVVVWDAQTGRQLAEARKDVDTIVSIAFNPEGTRLVTADRRHVRLWDASTAKPIAPPLGDDVTDWKKALFSPDGKTVFGGGANGIATAVLWEASTGKELTQLSHCQSLSAAAFSPNGNMIAMGCYWEGYTCVWSGASNRAEGSKR
ncbi:MAG TPA: WD40 repeat domain-containing protein [Tepidisphaeraceae bacterium]|jgi:WD40 repeat protein|nr:WD40 repeat domain-containing protein [Tepidisphaeraceae bacterium]